MQNIHSPQILRKREFRSQPSCASITTTYWPIYLNGPWRLKYIVPQHFLSLSSLHHYPSSTSTITINEQPPLCKHPFSEYRRAMPHKHSDPHVPSFHLPKPLKSMDSKKKKKNGKKTSSMPFLALPQSIQATGRTKGKSSTSTATHSHSYSTTTSAGR